jgi:hypothetical protein
MGPVAAVIVVFVVLAIIAAIVMVATRGSRASRGGVELPQKGSQHPGDPPFEGVERRDESVEPRD